VLALHRLREHHGLTQVHEYAATFCDLRTHISISPRGYDISYINRK